MRKIRPAAFSGFKLAALAGLALILSGCALSPSIAVGGAYFPDWLFCLIAGLILTVVVRIVLIRSGRERALGPRSIIYSAMFALFSMLVWLIFF